MERFINCKVLELSKFHWTGDQVALEALVRFSDEELKHQELFRRIERMIASKMPPGYNFLPEPNAVAAAVLSKSTWAVLGVTLMIELFTQTHYLKSIQPDSQLSPLFKDVFLYHWKEESQHARIDELEWVRENARLSAEERDQAVDDMIALVGAVDGIVCAQAAADVRYFLTVKAPNLSEQNSAAAARPGAPGLSLAVHSLRCRGAAVSEGAQRHGHRRANAADRSGASSPYRLG